MKACNFYGPFLFLLFTAGFFLCFAPQSRAEDSKTQSYILNGNDEIRLTIFGEDSLSGVYKMDGGGKAAIPLIGEVALSGLTAREAETAVRSRLADGYLVNPSVSIEILKYKPVYILGEVQTPGRYDYVSDMNALSAVALAGGFTYRARRGDVEILRAGKDQPARYQDFPMKTRLAPGDVIVVKESFF